MRIRDVVIKIAESESELLKLYQFRYSIYVEEMNRPQHDANHDEKIIRDSLDPAALNLIAIEKDEVVGAFRVNLASRGSLGGYDQFYEMPRYSGGSPAVSIATRFMVASRYRQSNLAVSLCVAAFEIGLINGVDYCFMDCNDHLVLFFERMGFAEYAGVRNHKEYGDVHRMRLHLREGSRLEALGSPFYASYQQWGELRSPKVLRSTPSVPSEVSLAAVA